MTTQQKIKRTRNKADREIQELGRKIYKKCLVCGGEYSCLHHFIYKSQSTGLRYYWDNLIPICNKCHSSLHRGQNDMIVGLIIKKKGMYWFDKLIKEKEKRKGKKYGLAWYENQSKLIQSREIIC